MLVTLTSIKHDLRFLWVKPQRPSDPTGQSLRASWTRWSGGFLIISSRWINVSAPVTQIEVDLSTLRILSLVRSCEKSQKTSVKLPFECQILVKKKEIRKRDMWVSIKQMPTARSFSSFYGGVLWIRLLIMWAVGLISCRALHSPLISLLTDKNNRDNVPFVRQTSDARSKLYFGSAQTWRI